MNATSLYVSTCRLVVQANADEQSSWNDLYRLLPYLRQSLSCTVCDKLLIEPYTPTESSCQHHVCKACRGLKKRLKPSCSWCKNYESYVENVQLRILLQCYKKLCEYLASTSIYKNLTHLASSDGTGGLLNIIQEGAGFKDDYKSSAGLTKSAYSILPCVFPINASATANVQTQTLNNSQQVEKKIQPLPRESPTLNEAPSIATCRTNPASNNAEAKVSAASPPPNIKKIKVRHPKQKPKRKGCRCGNATATPGKLTCCGQRCPCYVEAKSCTDCRCRGCRNPHTPGGKKLRPFGAGQEQGEQCGSSVGESSNTSVNSVTTVDLNLPSYVHIHGTSSTSLYSSSPLSVEQVPTTLMVDDEKSNSEDSDIDVDV